MKVLSCFDFGIPCDDIIQGFRFLCDIIQGFLEQSHLSLNITVLFFPGSTHHQPITNHQRPHRGYRSWGSQLIQQLAAIQDQKHFIFIQPEARDQTATFFTGVDVICWILIDAYFILFHLIAISVTKFASLLMNIVFLLTMPSSFSSIHVLSCHCFVKLSEHV